MLQKLEEIPTPSNPSDDNENSMGNINVEENEKDGENSTGGTDYCLSKIEKLSVPARVALLQNPIFWLVTQECLYIV